MCGFFFLASFLLFLFRSLSPVLLLLLLLLHDIIDVVVVVNCAAYANSESLHLMCESFWKLLLADCVAIDDDAAGNGVW